MRPTRMLFGASIMGAMFASVAACGWDPTRPFERESPRVNEALGQYDAGEASAAAQTLQDYLTTGGCKEGNIGTPLRVRERSNGSFDLGLAMFKIAEQYGQRFGDEENDGGLGGDLAFKEQRAAQVDCALRVVRAIADDPAQPASLRGRARYLEGNLHFLATAYKEAVTAYDQALEIAPGMTDAGPIGLPLDGGQVSYVPDPVGRDAAWNRAIALRRIEDKKDAGQDAAPNDGGNGEGGGNEKNDSKDGGGNDNNENNDAGKDSGGGDKDKDKDKDKQDAGAKDSGGHDDSNQPKKDPKEAEDAGAPPPSSRQNQDDRILDQLENAPTVQQEAAKKHAKGRRAAGMTDK